VTGDDVDLVALHLAVEHHLGLTGLDALAQQFGHGLDIALVKQQFLGDLPVGEVQPHEIQAQDPHPQRLVMAGEDRARQIVEAAAAVLADVALARVLGVVSPIADDACAGARHAHRTLRPAHLTHHLKAFRVVDQPIQADKGR